MSTSRLPPVVVVGSGRAGRGLALALRRRSVRVTLVARSPASRRAAKQSVGASLLVTTDLGAAVRAGTWIVLAVPDRRIGEIARDLAARGLAGWPRRVVLHLAGALGPAPLAPLAALGAAAGVLHPLLAFPRRASEAAGALAGAAARIEGDPRAVRAARTIAARVGIVPLRLRARPTSEDRALYHAAASLVANDLSALLSFGSELLVSLGAGSKAAEDALARLASSAARNAGAGSSIVAGLTGPVIRGDVETLERQLRSLQRRSRGAARAHALLSLRVLEIARRSGRLDPAAAAAMRTLLSGGRPRKRTV